jgi:hypothetical protein
MVLVPEWVARNERARQKLEARAGSSRHSQEWKHWNSLLRDIDPRLSYVFVPMMDDPPVGVIPLRWHIVRVNESGPDSYWPLLDDNGQYREIGSNDLEDFKGRDLWNSTVRHELATLRRRKAESKARAKETKREGRVDEIKANINALTRPSVLVSDVPWSNRSAGKRGRKR